MNKTENNRVLIVEDEESIATLLQYHLTQAGYDVTTAPDGFIAYEKALKEKFDVILLDWMLPRMDGMEVCKQLRIHRVLTPIIMLTAKDEELDKILGLELGADDYMTKPFSPREVIARVKAMIRRTKQQDFPTQEEKQEVSVLQVGEISIYPEQYEAYFQENLLELTPKEFELLYSLVKNKSRVMTRDQLLNMVWNYDFAGDTRIVDVHISNLREKIEVDTKKPRYIKTIRGLGYKLEEPK